MKSSTETFDIIQILTVPQYNEIHKQNIKLREIYLTPSLFAGKEITSATLKDLILNKIPNAVSSNIIFHLDIRKKEELLDQLSEVRYEIAGFLTGRWYIMCIAIDSKREEKVKKIVPFGLVTTATIDEALSQLQ